MNVKNTGIRAVAPLNASGEVVEVPVLEADGPQECLASGLRGKNLDALAKEHTAVRASAQSLNWALENARDFVRLGVVPPSSEQAPAAWMFKVVKEVCAQFPGSPSSNESESFVRDAMRRSAWQIAAKGSETPSRAVFGQDTDIRTLEGLQLWSDRFPAFLEEMQGRGSSAPLEDLLAMSHQEFTDKVGAALVESLTVGAGSMNPNIPFDFFGVPRRVSEFGMGPLAYRTADGGVLCSQAVIDNLELTNNPYDKQWYIIGVEVNEEDQNLYCSHTDARIPTACGDEEPVWPKLGVVGDDVDAFLRRVARMGDDLLLSEIRSYGRPGRDADSKVKMALDQLLREAAERGVLTDGYCRLVDGALPPEVIRRSGNDYTFRVNDLDPETTQTFQAALDVFGPLLPEGTTGVQSWLPTIESLYDMEARPELKPMVEALRKGSEMTLSPSLRSAIEANRERQADLKAAYERMKDEMLLRATSGAGSFIIPTYSEWLKDEQMRKAGAEAQALDDAYGDAAAFDEARADVLSPEDQEEFE